MSDYVYPGDRVVWLATVSNYGHQQRIPARVVRRTAKRVTIVTAYGDGKPERQVSVDPEKLTLIRCPECGATTHAAAECDMLG